jgi:hypothetical protein
MLATTQERCNKGGPWPRQLPLGITPDEDRGREERLRTIRGPTDEPAGTTPILLEQIRDSDWIDKMQLENRANLSTSAMRERLEHWIELPRGK